MVDKSLTRKEREIIQTKKEEKEKPTFKSEVRNDIVFTDRMEFEQNIRCLVNKVDEQEARIQELEKELAKFKCNLGCDFNWRLT